MKNSNLSFLILSFLTKSAVITFALFGIVMCVLWYPFSISLTTMGIVEAEPTVAQNTEMWTQLIFYWIVSIPCFILLAFTWKISGIMKREGFFCHKVARMFKFSSIMLFIDVIVFLMGNIIFVLLKWNVFAFLYVLIAVVGFAVSSALYVFSNCISKAIFYKEESDGLI